MEVIWKDIKGYDGKYQVSNDGQVWSVYSNRTLKGKFDKNGYRAVTLVNGSGKNKYERVHRLVALAFCHKEKHQTVVNHKNMNVKDNRAANLEWTTVAGNTKHAYDNSEEFRNNALKALKKATETNTMVIDVYKFGKYVGRFKGKEKCAEELGISPKTIYNSMNKKFENRKGYKFIRVNGEGVMP